MIDVRIRHQDEAESLHLMTIPADQLDTVIPTIRGWGIADYETTDLSGQFVYRADTSEAFFEVVIAQEGLMTRIIGWLRRIAAVEPVYVRSAIGLLVAVAGTWGANLAPLGDQVATTLAAVVQIAAITLTVLGIRDAVSPSAAVVARVDDPALPPHEVTFLAGGYGDVPAGAAVGRLSSLDVLTRLDR